MPPRDSVRVLLWFSYDHRPSTNEKDMIGNSDAGESVRSSAAPAGRLEDHDKLARPARSRDRIG